MQLADLAFREGHEANTGKIQPLEQSGDILLVARQPIERFGDDDVEPLTARILEQPLIGRP
jgi:hypothetical protein